MKYAFFIGCVSPVMARNYELSARKIAEKLGIKLVDIGDFACCGFPLKSIDHETPLLLAARNLSIAEEEGLDICTICNGCAVTLTEANRELQDNEVREKVNSKLKKIGKEYHGNVEVKHFTRVLYEDVGIERVKSTIKRELEKLRVAPHYGCHYMKPSDIYNRFEDPEVPKTLDDLISVTGAESVSYEGKIDCCGGLLLGIDENVAFTLACKKLDYVKAADADAICLMCPLCSIMYDRNQRVIERRLNKKFNIPVLFYPQLLGLALGFSPEELGLNLNRVKVSSLLAKLGVS